MSEQWSNVIADYVPVRHLGEAAGLFVALVRVVDAEPNASLSMIVGPNGASCAHEIATLSDTEEGIATAQTIGSIVLRALALNAQWRPGSSWQQEMD